LTKVYLKKNEDHRIKRGHFWIFSNEIHHIEGEVENGAIVEAVSFNGRSLGFGFYNKNSLIAVRLLHQTYSGSFENYAVEMLQNALSLRKSVYPERNSFRLVFSESDFLPGLIIDKYNNTYVLQVNSFGMEKHIDVIVRKLKDLFDAENIFSSNEAHFRKLEGLPEEDTIYSGIRTEETIDDGKVKYKINFDESQKTGFFFDQHDDREFIERLVKGKSVLDAFCNAGGFGFHAMYAGASHVTFVDSSQNAVTSVNENYKLNNFSATYEAVKEDVFAYLDGCIKAGKKFDVVILDPPAFAKSRKSLTAALKKYSQMNRLGAGCLNAGGFLVTSSCSYHVKEKDFTDSINPHLQMIYFNGASLDHPRLPAMEETGYLKFGVFRKS
jgi:23S rRNA (cytosine1962-C5)-methyltransferase